MKVIKGINKGESNSLTRKEKETQVKRFEFLFHILSNGDKKRTLEYLDNNSVPFEDVVKFMQFFETCLNAFKSADDLTKDTFKENEKFESQILEAHSFKIKGGNKTKEKAQKSYKVAVDVFQFLEQKGEKLPIKRSQIEKVIHPIWTKRATSTPPKQKTLFDFQSRYLNGEK